MLESSLGVAVALLALDTVAPKPWLWDGWPGHLFPVRFVLRVSPNPGNVSQPLEGEASHGYAPLKLRVCVQWEIKPGGQGSLSTMSSARAAKSWSCTSIALFGTRAQRGRGMAASPPH